ncbi:hypothetical protein AJ88_39585 [Mesorhizobium amorphae CCBAU 01583]|nr:hypothetical protein AJ88_39585 [Mesorhizobium amorphae CCBAU 01583]
MRRRHRRPGIAAGGGCAADPAAGRRCRNAAAFVLVRDRHAYRLLIDPGADAASDATPVTTATRRQAPEADTAQRGLALAQVTADEGGKPIVMAWLALLTAEVSPLRRAPAIGSEARQGQRGSRPGDMAEPEPRQMSVGLMSFGAGLLAVAIVGFVLMVLR